MRKDNVGWLFMILLLSLQIAFSNSLVKEKYLWAGDYLFIDSLSTYLEDSTIIYNFKLPNCGFYEFESFICSETAMDEKKRDTTLFDKSARYPNDTIIIETKILHGPSVTMMIVDTTYCTLGLPISHFIQHTSRKHLPVHTPLTLEMKILRMDCKFPYDDVKYYTSLRRASSFLR